MGINETLKAISDPVRRDILSMLKNGKKSAGEIAERFNLTGATVSYHLAKLKKADLIAEEKYKNYIYYTIVKHFCQRFYKKKDTEILCLSNYI